jgi:hypothetical protein
LQIVNFVKPRRLQDGCAQAIEVGRLFESRRQYFG